ncbi:hypothetical protein PSm6_46800 [Pseudomonas solani]|uniref:Uncharacterized protein n=1 Tax=Pseudomonas solani TaxID=2731552 RepID=A0ABN6BWS9_9PSED|nr:hypothetical protein PSm6_46800 [Pseudomonas solani]
MAEGLGRRQGGGFLQALRGAAGQRAGQGHGERPGAEIHEAAGETEEQGIECGRCAGGHGKVILTGSGPSLALPHDGWIKER